MGSVLLGGSVRISTPPFRRVGKSSDVLLPRGHGARTICPRGKGQLMRAFATPPAPSHSGTCRDPAIQVTGTTSLSACSSGRQHGDISL